MSRALIKSVLRLYAFIGACLGWFAVIAQLYLNIRARNDSIPDVILRFFAFFTIDTNILVAFLYTLFLVQPKSALGKFFLRPATMTATAVYISVVGIIYHLLLRKLWEPKGLQYVVDEILHTVVPVLFIVFWIFPEFKGEINWKRIHTWLIYPLIYITFIFLVGALTGFYPYPFTDVRKLGYSNVLLNFGGLIAAFLLFSLVLIAIKKLCDKMMASLFTK